jgi:RNase P/RNase MRP subunit p29
VTAMDLAIMQPLIGLSARVVRSANASDHHHAGYIIDETHNTVVLLNGARRRVIPKKIAVFELSLPDGQKLQLEGKALVGEPADRLRRAKRQRW